MNRFLTFLFFAALFLTSCSLFKTTPEPAPAPVAAKSATGASSDRNQVYTDQYQAAAMLNMQRSGVPASITLAQGILESGAGTSELAKNANNHFGVKCGNNWTGATYMKKDDDRDEKGNLKESCFRKYVKVEESYMDHAQFLRDPKKEQRYGFLFKLDPTDYKGWAHGLQSSGYSTSNTYADKLIDIIERYKLYEYDVPGNKSSVPPEAVAAAGATGADVPLQTASNRVGKINNVKVVTSREGESISDIAKAYRLSPDKVAEYNDRGYTPIQKLKANTRIFINAKKDKWSGSTANEHVVASNQTMFDISQLYGVKLNKLLERNGMSRGQEPAEGARINLNSKRPVSDPVALRDENAVAAAAATAAVTSGNPGASWPVAPHTESMTPNDDDLLEEISAGAANATPPPPAPAPAAQATPVVAAPVPALTGSTGYPTGNTNPTTSPATTQPDPWGTQPNPATTQPAAAATQPAPATTQPTATTTQPNPWVSPPDPAATPSNPWVSSPNPAATQNPPTPPVAAPGTHIVVKGDTLTNIAKKYNTSVATLLQLNNLKDGNIKLGQVLKVK